jgi:hypothetical protein
MKTDIKNEEQLLDRTLDVLEECGVTEAYQYLIANKGFLQEYSSQVYNYLYCLSASAGLKTEALDWIREAIIEKGYWYRPEVLEDSDLDSIRDEESFQECRKISDTRYQEALKDTATLCTWKTYKQNKLALVLHGNQQNIDMCRQYWGCMESKGYQVEYVQSKIIDSYKLYRWEEDSDIQLDQVVDTMEWDKYDSHILCGFSAGCNEILKTLLHGSVQCEGILFQSPWIPVIEEHMEKIMDILEENKIWIQLICGKNDKDCAPLVEKFIAKAGERKISCGVQWVEGLGHNYPDDFSDILNKLTF